MTYFWGSKLEWDLPYLLFAEVNVMYIPQDPPQVLYFADLLVASVQPVTSSYACAEVGLSSDSNRQSPGQKTNMLP